MAATAQQATPVQRPSQAPQGPQSNADGRDRPAGAASSKPTPAKTPKRRKRQLKIEDMKTDLALPYVYNNFYENFKKRRKGKGHEVSDLSTLLQLYYRWQHWAFPGFGFRDFIEKAQTFGGSHTFRKELDEFRK